MVASEAVRNALTSLSRSDRYPGALPFNDTPLDHRRFFGRDEETRLLMYQLLSVDLLVLFAMPGLGKTSLLNAKLFPLLRARDLLPLPVRFNATEHSLTPLHVFTAAIEQTCQAEPIDYTPGGQASLWEFFKTAVFWRGDRLQTPVLILDQFEELFTLQDEEFRHRAAAELGQLRGRRLPERLRQQLQEGQPLPFSDKPPEVKILLSVREDALGLLQEITPEIPTMLQNRFRLTGLSVEDARQAIRGPAALVADDIPFATRPFTFNETTAHEMIATARTKEGSIDPFFLQILCTHIEKQVRQKQGAGTASEARLVVDSSYLGGEQGIKALTVNFYVDALNQLTPSKLRRRARWLCEEGLLTGEGRRRGLLIEEIHERFKLDSKALVPLEQARLLRKEARHSSFSYEISHDRLAEAIREQRRWRLPREVKMGLAMFVVVVGVAAVLFTYFQTASRKHAEKAREQVEKVLDYIMFDLRDALTDLGGRALLDDIQQRVDAYYERMSSVGESDDILRRKAVSYDNRGDLFLNRGNRDAAWASYQIALAMHKQLAARDPANPQWQRDLSVSYERIGDVQYVQGALAAALSAYQHSQQLREQLATRDPANLERQRDLSVSYERIGDVQRAQGDGQAALSAYQHSQQLREQLATRDPANTEWQRDLSVSYERIGDVQRAQGALAAALRAYQHSLHIDEQLAVRDPANTEWQRDLSVSYERIGDVQRAQGDGPAALRAYQHSQQLREQLAARDPANTEWQRDLSVSYNKIGDVQRAQGALAAALSAYQHSLQLREQLAARDPANPQWQMDVAVSLYKSGAIFEQQHPPRKQEAATNYQRILHILRPLAAANRLAADQKGLIADVEKRLGGLKD